MTTLLRVIGAIIVVGLVALAAFIFVPQSRTRAQTASVAASQPGEVAPLYATRLADCAACHTAEGGKPFAEVTKNATAWTPEIIQTVGASSKEIKKKFAALILD